MRITVKEILIPIVLITGFTLLLSACNIAVSEERASSARTTGSTATSSSDTPAAATIRSDLTQTSEGGQVTVKVTWNGPSDGPVFKVVMDTHAVDLDSYDLQELAVLRTDKGIQVMPSKWEAPKGGHHRSGTLSFPALISGNTPLIEPGTRSIELIIQDVAGVPQRIFRWTL